jgi:hypothetical protein
MNRIKATSFEPEELNDLEAQLAGTLRPVEPPRALVRRLRGRIRFPSGERIVRRLNDWNSLFVALGGVLSGMLLLITVARALYSLVGRRAG